MQHSMWHLLTGQTVKCMSTIWMSNILHWSLKLIQMLKYLTVTKSDALLDYIKQVRQYQTQISAVWTGFICHSAVLVQCRWNCRILCAILSASGFRCNSSRMDGRFSGSSSDVLLLLCWSRCIGGCKACLRNLLHRRRFTNFSRRSMEVPYLTCRLDRNGLNNSTKPGRKTPAEDEFTDAAFSHKLRL